MNRYPSLLLLVCLLPVVSPAQTFWAGTGPYSLDAAMEYDLVNNDLRLRADIFGTGEAAPSNGTLWVMPLAAWPDVQSAIPFLSFYPGVLSGQHVHAELPVQGAFSAPPALVVGSTVDSSGLHLTGIYAFDVEYQPGVLAGGFDRVAWMRIGVTGSQETVFAEIHGGAGDMLRLVDPSNMVRATATLPGPGAPATFFQVNDHPVDQDWRVELSTDNGASWSTLLGN